MLLVDWVLSSPYFPIGCDELTMNYFILITIKLSLFCMNITTKHTNLNWIKKKTEQRDHLNPALSCKFSQHLQLNIGKVLSSLLCSYFCIMTVIFLEIESNICYKFIGEKMLTMLFVRFACLFLWKRKNNKTHKLIKLKNKLLSFNCLICVLVC